jgi:hypothetical protein
MHLKIHETGSTRHRLQAAIVQYIRLMSIIRITSDYVGPPPQPGLATPKPIVDTQTSPGCSEILAQCTRERQDNLPWIRISPLFATDYTRATGEHKRAVELVEPGSSNVTAINHYLMRPTVHCVQAILLIILVLQNDMRPQAAWMLLGVIVRRRKAYICTKPMRVGRYSDSYGKSNTPALDHHGNSV